MFLFFNGPQLRAGSYCYLVISYILFVWVTSSQHTAWKIGRWSATLPGHDLVGHWRSHCVPHGSSSDESLCMGTRGQWETSWEGMIGRHLFAGKHDFCHIQTLWNYFSHIPGSGMPVCVPSMSEPDCGTGHRAAFPSFLQRSLEPECQIDRFASAVRDLDPKRMK